MLLSLTFAMTPLLLADSSIPFDRAHPHENSKPNVEAIQQAEAWDRDLDYLENESNLIRISKLRCDNIPIRKFAPNGSEWNLEAVARCRYEVTLNNGHGWDRPVQKTEMLTYKRQACGEEGQETDLWCYFWYLERPIDR